jgi:DNA-binding XRE family transcriptional regulator
MSDFQKSINFKVIECGGCGQMFAMTTVFFELRQEDHKSWYCPNGCCRHYTGKSKAAKLQSVIDRKDRELEAEKGRSAMLAHEVSEVKKTYGKMRDRVKNGVCPCCNRTFQNLMEHMKTKHPEFGKHETLRSIRDMFGLTQSALAKEVGITSPGYISNYENDRPVPDYAKRRIEQWMDENA